MWAHVTLVQRELHWLLIEYWIHFKVLVLTSKALRGLGLTCLSNRLFLYMPQEALQFAEQEFLVVPGPRDAHLASATAEAFSALAPPGRTCSDWRSGLCRTCYHSAEPVKQCCSARPLIEAMNIQ